MKLLINISLFTVVLSQLCSASDDITKDKRYPLFNLIATKANVYTTNELLEYGHIHSDLWPQYNGAIASNEKSADYKEFSNRMEQVIEVLKKLEKDKDNCDLQKDTWEKIHMVYKTESATKWREFDNVKIREQQMRKEDLENLHARVNEIYEQLPAAIESFIQGLDEKEKEQYNQLLKSCQQFLEAKNNADKLSYFSTIVALFRDERKFKGDLCKAKALADFELKTLIYLL